MFLLYLFLFQHIVIQFVKNHVRIVEPVRNHLKSDLFVSSKPGVSTKQISESTSPGNEMAETWLVKDAKPCPTIPVILVANSMNFLRPQK